MWAFENGPRIYDETWAFVEERLGQLWSPEQIRDSHKDRSLL
jgi:hypothetical protein